MILLLVHGRIRSVLALHAHLVVVTEFRHPVFTATHLEREQIMRAVCADFETELAEFNGETSHVHLLVDFPPEVAVSLVDTLARELWN